jgi:hypothetical protein
MRTDDRGRSLLANTAVQTRPQRGSPSSVAVPPQTLLPGPSQSTNLRDRFLADPVVQRTFALVPIDVAMVELDRLVVFQKHVNLAYVHLLTARLEREASDAAVFRFCLPFDQRCDPVPLAARTAQNGWTFSSPSNDFRPLGVALLSPEQVEGFELTGVPVAIVAFAVGYGSNFLSALEVEGRLILSNGSHRAYALREAGYKHAPCLIQRVSRRDELEVVGNEEVAQHAERYLDAPRPPVLKDYFDEKLRMTVHVPATMRQYQVNVGVGAADVPRG